MPSLQFRRQLWDVQKRLSSLAEHLGDPGLHKPLVKGLVKGLDKDLVKGLNHLLNLMAGPARHKGRATRHATKTSVLIFIRQCHTTICACFLQFPSLFKVLQGHSMW